MARELGFVSGIVTGALAGAALAMLVTPLAGPSTRESLRLLAARQPDPIPR